MIPGKAVSCFVGANSFARNSPFVRMNSHLQAQHDNIKQQDIFNKLLFLG